ncbi:MAG: hypothetical protein BWK76_14325 [Desulfobulbaceae bacterium A2]|nr:MAG: hypothetical protein BWK76_14325 [Desulfobulbaceae bacterium A2]
MHSLSVPVGRPVCAALALCLLLSLSGCATMKEWFGFSGESIQASADSLAIQAMDDYNVGKYTDAHKAFQEILDRFPFGPQAMLAELKSADCQYYLQKYSEAKSQYQTFEERHPTNEAIPYVMFQIGMCDYRRIDRIDRDVSGARDAIESFSQLLRAYPETPYSGEAKARVRAAQEFLVNHEYFIATFYVRTGKHDQAKTRLKYILGMYPEAAVIPQAKELLARLESANPPKSGWKALVPDFSLPDWQRFRSDSTAGPKE